MKRLFPLILLFGCEGPADAVLASAFLLEPPPAAADPAFSASRGRCDLEPPAKTLRCTCTGLPPGRYELKLLVGPTSLPPRFDGRALERAEGPLDPDGPAPPMYPPLPRASLGLIEPDAVGRAERVWSTAEIPLSQVVGGELMVSRTEGAAPVVALDGRVGNVPDEVTTAAKPPPAPTGGHSHH